MLMYNVCIMQVCMCIYTYIYTNVILKLNIKSIINSRHIDCIHYLVYIYLYICAYVELTMYLVISLMCSST